MADLFADYPFGRAWDEMFAGPGVIRDSYESVHSALQTLTAADLKARADIMGRTFLDQGITFALGGVERPFPLDLIPRIVTADEWRVVQDGVPQRVRALEAFLADSYGPGRIFADGVVPRRLVTTSPHFHRQVAGMGAQDGARIVISGVDLIRDEQGSFRVLEDNVRVPSGVSYVLENRQAVAQVLAEASADQDVRPVSEYPGRLLAALWAVAPPDVADPTVVVLTPGVFNSAYFEHTLLAREMGVELVEGRDLVCRNNRVYVRTTGGEMPVHVIYRRVDDEFLDPLQFRLDSLLGSPGLVNAARAGHLTIANAVGNGIADDKLVYTYVPDIIRYYLREEPILPNVDTYRMEDPDHRDYALEHLAELVVKPVDGSGGKGIVIGSRADRATLARTRTAILDNPRGFIAQREIALSTVPTLIGDRMRPRHVDLRPFAVNDGSSVWVLPGGLTRVALPEGELVVNSSQGGGSKDTWVLAGRRADDRSTGGVPGVAGPAAPVPGGTAPDGPDRADGPDGTAPWQDRTDDAAAPWQGRSQGGAGQWQGQSQGRAGQWQGEGSWGWSGGAQDTGAFLFEAPVEPDVADPGLRHQQGQQQQGRQQDRRQDRQGRRGSQPVPRGPAPGIPGDAAAQTGGSPAC
nr:circularly permuted type 2 ATP-grasp protein [Nakamurella endophytica]